MSPNIPNTLGNKISGSLIRQKWPKSVVRRISSALLPNCVETCTIEKGLKTFFTNLLSILTWVFNLRLIARSSWNVTLETLGSVCAIFGKTKTIAKTLGLLIIKHEVTLHSYRHRCTQDIFWGKFKMLSISMPPQT